MRKAVSLVSAIILIALIVSILRSAPDDEPTTFSTSASSTSTIQSTDASTPVSTTPTTQPLATDSTSEATTTTESGVVLEAEFVISQIIFGDNGYVAITNVGGAAGDLDGYALCQRPSYFVMEPLTVEPFETVWVAAGDGASLTNPSVVAIVPANGQLGRLTERDGEMALYRSAQFSAADEMRSYVEWGESDHQRSALAVEAGLWEAGAFVEIPSDTFGVSASVASPSSPEDWVAAIGG